MKRLAWIAVAALIGCQPATPAFLDLDGWQAVGEAQTYSTDTLADYINGAAELFIDYGFELLTVHEVAHGERTVAINVYNMGTPLNAFGVFRSEAPADAERVGAGTEAVVLPPYQALLYRDRYYVKLDAIGGEIDSATGAALLTAAADALDGSTDQPALVATLPDAGKIPGSERYTTRGLLGLSELSGCIYARYAEDGLEYRVFLMVPPDQGIDAVWEDLATTWTAEELAGRPALHREVPYSGLVGVIRTEHGIMGVSDCADVDQLAARLGVL